jgi:S1/P1 Nuclease
MKAVALLSLNLALASAWNCNGHMLVAQIAFNNVQPATQTMIESVAAYLAPDYPTSPDFVQASCWADDIKSWDSSESIWHYVDLPVFRGSIYFPFLASELNISSNPWAINQALKTLSSTRAPQIDLSRSIRFLIHFWGDLAQPLHAATLISAQFPNGDAGGNSYKIDGTNYTNLHSLWDSGVQLFDTYLTRPLNASSTDILNGWASTITTTYPASSFPAAALTVSDPFQIADESNKIANDFVYTAPQASEGPIPYAYIQQGQTICSQQIALAGYRLANALDTLYAATQVHRNLRGN